MDLILMVIARRDSPPVMEKVASKGTLRECFYFYFSIIPYQAEPY